MNTPYRVLSIALVFVLAVVLLAVARTFRPTASAQNAVLESSFDLVATTLLPAAAPQPSTRVVVRQPAKTICAGKNLDAVAGERGISAHTARELIARGMPPNSLCTISDAILKRAIAKLQPKPDEPDEAVRWRMLAMRDENGYIDPQGLMRGKEHVERMKAAAPPPTADAPPVAGITRAGWTAIGPGNVGGRIRAMAINPANANHIWIGSVAGGIWKTTDGGASWAPQDDFMANLAVTSIVMNPANANELYASTGEGFFNADSLRGAGIFKTTNGGTTWTQLPSTSTAPSLSEVDFHYTNRLAMAPGGGTLLAVSTFGIYRSTNGGTSFTRSTVSGFAFSWQMTDVDFHPTNPLLAVASGFYSTALYSTDGGVDWDYASGLPVDGGRVELAYAPSNPSIVYASVENETGGALYKSTNGGVSYSAVVSTISPAGGQPLGGQGWYDNIIWVNPLDPNFLIWGGIDLWRSTDGGANVTQISDWAAHSLTGPTSAHADQHIIVAHPGFNNTSNKTVFFGNDGGIYKATDISTIPACTPFTDTCKTGWTELNNGLGITQFYGGAGHVGTGRITGGTQDNGTLFYNPAIANPNENWTRPFGGDGGFSGYDSADANYFYGEYVRAQVHRNSTGGASDSQYIWAGIADANTSNAEFIAAFRLDPNDNNRMFVAGASLWRTTDVKAATPTWESVKSALPFPDLISAIGITPGNSNGLYAGHDGGRLYKTTQGLAAAATVRASWTALDDNDIVNPFPNYRITRITVDPANPNIVYVTLGGYQTNNVFRSVTGGGGWTDISGPSGGTTALPDVPVRSLVVHPSNSNWLYAGTEVGVFASIDGGTTWSVPHDGPSNVSVDELFFMGTKLVAVTHGRGMFTANTVTPSGTATGRRRNDFNGDGRSDIAVFRPSNGSWYVNGGGTTVYGNSLDTPVAHDYDGNGTTDRAVFRQATGQWFISTPVPISRTWGGSGDIPVPDDYDGDNKADIAVFRPATGSWFILTSASNFVSSMTFTWGIGTDIPAPGDYDNDGKTDIAVYRAATGSWFILKSTTAFTASMTQVWGNRLDHPVPGDYDGDGITDFAVFRRSNGTWYIKLSTGPNLTRTFGAAIDWPVLGDFDADGKSDIAAFRPETGQLFVLNSVGGFVTSATTVWGTGIDVPIGVNRPRPEGTRAADYDNDRRTDPSVYRPSTGAWYLLKSSSVLTTSFSRVWGTSVDTPVVGDFDGDGTTDIGVYRAGSGQWFVLTSSSGFISGISAVWGAGSDVPVPGDYDGDRITDIAVYRPGSGNWYVSLSGGGTISRVFGAGSDLPIVGDWDGDGRTDLGVYRQSTGAWYYSESLTGVTRSFTWGGSIDTPVPGDFDGDGKLDLAVFRASTGVWYIALSSYGFGASITRTWGNSIDTPVPADYDGDGKTEVAVWRELTGVWYVLKSNTSFASSLSFTWGNSADFVVTGRR